MKAIIAPLVAVCLASSIQAFTIARQTTHTSHQQRLAPPLGAYVPSGLTPEQYKQVKAADVKKVQGKNLGALRPRGFKSRSMQAWQEAYEKGLTGHSVAPIGYREALKKREIKKEDVPYMVRGGSWDNSDVKGAKRKQWLKIDKVYACGGYKKGAVGITFRVVGPGFDWTGTRSREEDLKNKVIPGLS